MESNIRIKWFDSLDSTNSELLRHLSDYDNLSVVAAVEQFAGRGQRGNRWKSAVGENLTFSLLLKPSDLPALEFMAITYLAATVVRDWLREQGVPAVVKWPNDVYAGGRKICGMLIENGLERGNVAWSVIGIGINLNQTAFPGDLVNPTSVKRLTGKHLDPKEALINLCSLFESRLPELTSGRDRLYDDYCDGLFQLGLPRPYRDLASGKEFTGTIKGVSRDGRLLIEKDGAIMAYSFKEVGYIL